MPLKQPLPPGPPVHSTDASQKPYGEHQLAPPSQHQHHQGSGRGFSHDQTIASNQSSPYASISRYSQQQQHGGSGYRSKSPPQPPSRPSHQHQHSKQSQFTAVWSKSASSKSSTKIQAHTHLYIPIHSSFYTFYTFYLKITFFSLFYLFTYHFRAIFVTLHNSLSNLH